MWKILQHRNLKHSQDLRVSQSLKEIAMYTYASYADQLKEVFEQTMDTIPKFNSFSASNMYKCTVRDNQTCEIWRVDAQGNTKHLLWTLTYQRTSMNI